MFNSYGIPEIVGCVVASEQLFREVDKLFKPTR